jgi:hypothetical protein
MNSPKSGTFELDTCLLELSWLFRDDDDKAEKGISSQNARDSPEDSSNRTPRIASLYPTCSIVPSRSSANDRGN